MERLRVKGRFARAPAEDGGEAAPTTKILVAAPRAKYCRSFTRSRIAEALPEITEKFLTEAKKGSIQHAKLLIRLGELDGKDIAKPARSRGKGFAGRLLDDLNKAARKRDEARAKAEEG